ncbi:FG-GAP repeat protein [Candidatus Sumerlaeota bacterium]
MNTIGEGVGTKVHAFGGYLSPRRVVGIVAICMALSTSGSGEIPQVKIENPQSGFPTEEMGRSVSVDGDTVVVGAPDTNANGTSEAGTVQIFRSDGLGSWTLETEIIAADAEAEDGFGCAVSLSGNTAIIGARGGDEGTTNTGSVYVYTRSGSVWTFQQKLTASDAAAYDAFGYTVSISGDTALVGAPYEGWPGAAYVFTRTGGVWSQQTKITGDAEWWEEDGFGWSVAVSGDTAVVGELGEDDKGSGSGAAYVFTRSGGVWSRQAKLYASVPAERDYFGISVAISGDTIIVGAQGEDWMGPYIGSAHVFTRAGGVWSHQAKLTEGERKYFGYSVAVSGDTAVVGAPRYGNVGATFVFTRSGGVWSQQIRLLASDYHSDDYFGISVSVSGDTAAVGAFGVDDGGPESGAAYVFTRSGAVWTQEEKLTGPRDTALYDNFGDAVAISGDTTIIGVKYDDDLGNMSGSAYIFTLSGNDWIQQAKLTADDGAPDDGFGESVSISGDTAVVGTWGDDDAGDFSGSAYVFTRTSGVWTQEAKLVANDAEESDLFGRSVSVSGDAAVVGAVGDDDAGYFSGSAYVFIRSGGIWTQQAKLTASDADMFDMFGESVAISGDTVVVGADEDSDIANSAGSVYVFTGSGGVWTQQQKLTAADTEASDYFGSIVAVSGDTAVVGARGDDDGGNYSGSAYVFRRSGGVWTQEAKLVAPDPAESDYFGRSVAVSGDRAVIGVLGDDDGGESSGSTYVFTRSGGVWTQEVKLTASDAAASDSFGSSVAVDGARVICGASGDDDPESSSGSAYVFDFTPPDTEPATVPTRIWRIFK